MDLATRDKQFGFWKKAVARSKGWLKDEGDEAAAGGGVLGGARALPLLAAVGIGAVIGMALSRITSRL